MIVEDLYTLKENIDGHDANSLNVLLEALNDWPNNFETLEEYLIDIKMFLGTKNITIESIKQKLFKLNPNIHAWERESLTGFMELINKKAENKSLHKIIYLIQSE